MPCCSVRQCSQRLQASDVEARSQQRSEEAAFGALFLQDTHFSQFPRHSPHCSKPPCKRPSRRSLSCSMCLGAPCRIHDADCELCHCKLRGFLSFHQFSWLVVLLDRMRWQADVVWSDESFSGCASSPLISHSRSCHDTSCSQPCSSSVP